MESNYINDQDDDQAVKQGLLTEPVRIRVMNPPPPPLITIRR